MASPRTTEGLLAAALGLVLIGGVYYSPLPAWMGWIAAGVALLVAWAVARWRWADDAVE